MNFNFSETAGITSSNAKPQLEGNKIHTVTFDGCEARDIQGVKDASAVYKVLEIKFSNDEGVFTHTIWEPRPEDAQDTQSMYGPSPSPLKNMTLLLQHMAAALNPVLNDKFVKLPKDISWDQLRQFIAQEMAKAVGKQVEIKLLKNKSGQACFPGFIGTYDRTGALRLRTNFIGNKLVFTPKETANIVKQATAKPTTVSDTLPNTAGSTSESSDLNFDIASL